MKQRDYDPVEQADLAEECIANLNPDQWSAFDKLTSAITNSTEETFFLYGPGGTSRCTGRNDVLFHSNAV